MVALPEYKILCPMRSVKKFVFNSSAKGTQYAQVFNTVNVARSRVVSLNSTATKSIVY